MKKINIAIQNTLIAFIMASSVTAWYHNIPLDWLQNRIFNIPVMWIVLFILSLFVANDVRYAFQKVLWYDKRSDKLPIWQVGIGMLFYFTQVSIVEIFMRPLMEPALDGMPLYLVISFLNAFLLTVIYQEIFYVKKQQVEAETNTNKQN